jgi:uncharacterized membrane protein
LAQLTREHLIEIEDPVVVTREDDGKVKLHQTPSTPPAPGRPAARCGAH